jgi:hypothetical protein
MPRCGWRNVLGFLSAVLQLALPPAVAYADGRLATEGNRAQPHVESDRSSKCAPVHSPECALCRVLAHHVSSPVAAATWVDIANESYSPFADRDELTHVSTCALPPARAPPIA